MTRLAESPARQIGTGLAIAAFAQLLSLFLAGAGHGWVTPLGASLILWAMTPVALMVALPGRRAGRATLLPMLLVALLADAWLARGTLAEQDRLAHYLQVNGLVGLLIVALWIGSWLFWQGLVAAALLSGKAGR